MTSSKTLQANWQVAGHVHSLITQKNTCFSRQNDSDVFGFNLATHVGDALDEVEQRREMLKQELSSCAPIQWLQQVHGDHVLCLDDVHENSTLEADACFSFQPQRVCAVTTADCVPILLTDTPGQFVAAIHAGWQGLYKGIIGKTILKIRERADQQGIVPGDLQAYIAPAISIHNYQVDEAFYHRFISLEHSYKACFKADGDSKYRADIKAIAHLQLIEAGVGAVHDSGICTYQNHDFYSYRRATHLGQKQCGRFVSLLYLGKS